MTAVFVTSLCKCGGDASSPAAEQLMLGSAETEPNAAPPAPLLSVDRCHELGGAPIGLTGVPGMGVEIGDPMVDSSSEDACPLTRRKLGTLESEFDPNGGLCCEIPPLLSVEGCEEMGGIVVADPGGGGTFYLGCKGVFTDVVGTVIGWLICESPDFCAEGAICCRR